MTSVLYLHIELAPTDRLTIDLASWNISMAISQQPVVRSASRLVLWTVFGVADRMALLWVLVRFTALADGGH